MADETYTTDPALRDERIDGASRPADLGAARSEIEMTRARMSETIDDIEDALLRKKERIQDRLDFTAPVRENPIPSAAMALGAGLLLGLLTGGGEEHDAARGRDERLDEAEERARTWESRARRLMRVAQDQEALLEDGFVDELEWEMDEPDRAGEGDRLRDRIAAGVSGFVSDLTREILTSGRR